LIPARLPARADAGGKVIGRVVVPLVLAATMGVATMGSTADSTGRYPSPEQKRMFDSLAALPDSAWEIPEGTGLSRQAIIEFYRRLARNPDSLYAGPDSAHVPDSLMAARFRRHASDFERLRRMFVADSAFDRVWRSDQGLGYEPSALPPRRQAEYDRLLSMLGIRLLVRESGTILFRTTTVWTFDRKGYVWSARPLKPLVEDETTSKAHYGAWRVFRALGMRGWYIYFQSSS
jgi:hypothetical protein